MTGSSVEEVQCKCRNGFWRRTEWEGRNLEREGRGLAANAQMLQGGLKLENSEVSSFSGRDLALQWIAARTFPQGLASVNYFCLLNNF